MTTVAQEVSVGRRRRRWEVLPYGLVLPTVAYLALFFAWPMEQAFKLAFRDGGAWTIEPFRTMVNDANFKDAFKFTMLLVVVIVPLQFVLALAMALLINSRLHGRGVFLAIFIMPLAISDLAAGLVWQSILTERGYLNTVLEHLGLIDQPYIWLDPTKPNQLLFAVVVAELWRSTAFVMVIFLAGLQGIPAQLYEAAAIDGATSWHRFRYITVPMLAPTTFFVMIISIIGSFQVFDLAFVLTRGGPGEATNTMVMYIYNQAFQFFHMGYAASIAWVLFGIIFVITLVQTRLQKLWVHYENE
jgi:multiple sugar transport system permease protein